MKRNTGHAPGLQRVDTLLLDMDGTLLDLAYDNHFWREVLPAAWGRAQGLSEDEARRRLFEQMRRVQGRLAWYCLDHWSEALRLDVRALKLEVADRIRFLPQAEGFLRRARASGKRLVLVTNAHRDTLALKLARTGLADLVDVQHSSHDFGVPKESLEFWSLLQAREGFDPRRSLLVEDSLAVLDSARAWGLERLVAVRRPDSSRPVRRIRRFAAVCAVAELLPETAVEGGNGTREAAVRRRLRGGS